MSNIQRWSLLGLAVVVLVVGYIVLRPKDDDSDPVRHDLGAREHAVRPGGDHRHDRDAGDDRDAAHHDRDDAARAADPDDHGAGREPVDGVQELDFTKGDTIAFKVTANAPGGEVHFHGYDIAKEIPASGGSVTYKVPATIEGIFEVELEATGVQIAKVVVQP